MKDNKYGAGTPFTALIIAFIDESMYSYAEGDGSKGDHWDEDIETFNDTLGQLERMIYVLFDMEGSGYGERVKPDDEPLPDNVYKYNVSREDPADVFIDCVEDTLTGTSPIPSPGPGTEAIDIIKVTVDSSGSTTGFSDIDNYDEFSDWLHDTPSPDPFSNAQKITEQEMGNERWLTWLTDEKIDTPLKVCRWREGNKPPDKDSRVGGSFLDEIN